MSKQISPLLIGGIGIAAIYFFKNSGSTNPTIPTGTAAAILPGTTTAYGINPGPQPNGRIAPCLNYAQLAQQYPNLLNPNYQMTAAENAQYLGNYLDLQQAMPQWVGHKMVNGVRPANVAQAAQAHWNMYGCAEKRIFLPLQPPSNAQYIPPPPNPNSSGSSSVLSTGLKIAATVLPYAIALLGPGQPDPQLNDADLQLLFTGGAIMKDILPMFMTNDPVLTTQIDQHFTALLTPYYV